MRNLLSALTLLIVTALAAVGQTPALPSAQSPVQYSPAPNIAIVASEYLPTLPAGWYVVNVEPVISGGNTIAYVQMFLFKPSTGQSAVWLVQQ